MKKYKRLIAIIPIVFTLLLSCVPILSAHAETFGQSFVGEIDTDYSEFATEPFDLTASINMLSKSAAVDIFNSGTNSTSAYYRNYFHNSEYYFYSVYVQKSEADYYIENPNSNRYPYIWVFYVTFQDLQTINSDSRCLTYSNACALVLRFRLNSDGSLTGPFVKRAEERLFCFNYFTDTGFCSELDNRDQGSLSSYTSSDIEIYSYYEETNIPDFPYAGNSAGGGSISVDVRFRPGLSGSVDRMLDNGYGTKSMVSQMRMTVVNNSRFPIQYKMYISKRNQTTSRGGNIGQQHVNESYDDDPVFVYYSDEWVYHNNLDNSSDWYNGHVQKQNKSTEWHYVGSGGSIAVLFNYSQINLKEGEQYICTVEAVRNNYDAASHMFVTHATSEAAYPDYKQLFLDDKAVVYQSEFSMLYYSDVKYDPNDTSNGVNPYGSYADSLNYEWSYNAVEDSSGNIDYSGKNLFKDKNSWYYSQYSPESINIPGSYSSSSSESFDSLSGTLSGYFNLVSSVLGFFPSSVLTVFSLGITSVVIVAFFKAVFK